MATSQSEKAAARRREALNPKLAAEGGNGRGVTVADNMTEEQRLAAFYETEEAQLISIMDQIRRGRTKEAEEKAKVDAAKLVHKEAQNAVTKVFQNAKVLGFQRNDLEEHYKKVTEKGIRKNQQADENRRARWLRYWNLPTADSGQQELAAKLPETEKDAQDYEAEGYKAGLNSEECKPPMAAVKAGHDQAWLRGHEAATARKAWGMTAVKSIPLPTAKPVETAAENSGEAV